MSTRTWPAGDHLFTTVAHLAAAANPLLLPVARAVDYTVERWADERAAAITGDRRLVASTIGQVALLATAPAPPACARRSPSPAPVADPISLAWAGPVPRRVAALLAPPPRRQLALLAIVAILDPHRRRLGRRSRPRPARPARVRPGRPLAWPTLSTSRRKTA